LDVNKGDAFHPEQALSQGFQIEQTARAVWSGRSHGQVHFTVLSDVDALDDVEFGVGLGVVWVSPSRQNASNTALEGDVLPSHAQPSVLVLDQVFGVVKAQFGQSAFHLTEFLLAPLEQRCAFLKHGQRLVKVLATSFELAYQVFQSA